MSFAVAFNQSDVVDSSALQIANQTSAVENDDWVIIVDTVILSLTILGAVGIMSSMAYLELKGRASTTRTRLVQSLVVSDLVVGLVGLIGSVLELDGKPLMPGTSACDGLGVMLVTVLWTEHFWTLTLAAATYMILIHPMHNITLWLEKRWYYLWVLVWALAFGIAVMGYELYGYFPNGGVCFYGSNSGLYGELIQFLPRALVFIFITFFYIRLFVFLRRPDRIRSPYSESPTNGSYADKTYQSAPSRYRRRISDIFRRRKSSGGQSHNVSPMTFHPSMFSSPRSPEMVDSRRASQTGRMEDIPPWERVELPSFQVDGQRFGGSAANTVPRDTTTWNDWKGFGGKKRPTTASSGATTPAIPLVSPRAHGSLSSAKDFPGFKIDKPALTPHLESELKVHRLDSDGPRGRSRSAGLSGSDATLLVNTDRNLPDVRPQSVEPPLTPSTSSTRMAETPNNSQQFDPEIRRGSATSQANESRRGSSLMPPKRTDFTAVNEEYDPERAGDDEEDNDLDLMRVLQQTAPADDDGGFGVRSGSEQFDYMPESMSSYLNRKTALLMLWFPLGYVLLFSISLVRVIYDFASDNPAPVLRALSRWFIFAQGVLDALIYGLVEWHTKRVVRKRVRRGVLSPGGSRNGQSDSRRGSDILSFGGGRRSQPLNANSASQQHLSSQPGQTVSFAEQEDTRSRTIHQRLAPAVGADRKSSLANSVPRSPELNAS